MGEIIKLFDSLVYKCSLPDLIQLLRSCGDGSNPILEHGKKKYEIEIIGNKKPIIHLQLAEVKRLKGSRELKALYN